MAQTSEPIPLAEGTMPSCASLNDVVMFFANDLKPISQGFVVSLGILIGNRTMGPVLNIY
jgi:hypothetical protein